MEIQKERNSRTLDFRCRGVLFLLNQLTAKKRGCEGIFAIEVSKSGVTVTLLGFSM